MLSKIIIVAAIAALPAAYAVAQIQTQTDTSQSGMMGGMMQGGMMMKPGLQMSEADQEYMAAMQTMEQRMMQMEMTGDPSADFAA